MQDPQPSLQDWHTLYRAAIDFRQIQPWHWVKREEAFQLFEALASRLGLKMKQVKRLKHLEYAKKSMNSFLASGKM